MEVPALLLDRDLSMRVGTRVLPKPASDEVVVEVEWAGTDLHVFRTGDWIEYWPATPCHEVAGRVIESTSADFPVGTAVALDSRLPCGHDNGVDIYDRFATEPKFIGEARSGGFAGAVVVPVSGCHKVPDGMSTEDAVLAEPLAVAMCALDNIAEMPTRVLILGHGPMGALTHAEAARRWPSAAITVIEPDELRASLANSMGADVQTDFADNDFDLVVDAAGYPRSLADAVRAARPAGSILLVALGHTEARNILTADIVNKSLKIWGSNCFDTAHLDEALTQLAADPRRYRLVVSDRIPLAELPDFVSDGLKRGIKVIVRCTR